MTTRDDMVLEVQVWLNETYGEEIVEAMGGPIEENGKTSWDVTNGLLIGLQVELGVPTPAPSFGPTTEAYLDAYGPISEGNNDSNANINQIIQGGCYATGYNPYGFNGVFDENLTNAIKELESNIGLSESGIVDTKLMKALLTMNAYVLLAGGSNGVRDFQQWLNGTYRKKEAFDYIPCDGLYSRTTQEGIVYGIQYECDLDDVANGSFGPTTKANLKEKGQVYVGDNDDNTGKNFVHLFTGAFLCNNIESNIVFDGVFDEALSLGVNSFQEFTAITVDGQGNYETWCELLVSTGDETRATTALDCSVEKVTEERAAYFKEQGYKYIGRYIVEIEGGLDKALEQAEIDNIFANDMSIIPLFQMGGSYSEYFTTAMGKEDAEIAYTNAREQYGIPRGTTIYFAVDYDAYEYEASGGIAEYFQAINDYFNMYPYYSIGIYASRNICQIVCDAGLAKYSYVSGMSTGYSGNLGYSLPTNWTFNQIAEDYDLGIDKVVANDVDKGFNEQFKVGSNYKFFQQLSYVREEAIKFQSVPMEAETVNMIVYYYRMMFYTGFKFNVIFGFPTTLELAFGEYMIGILPEEERESLYDINTGEELDVSHMMAVLATYRNNFQYQFDTISTGDFGSWCGDFITVVAQYYRDDIPDNYTITEWIEEKVKGDLSSYYSYQYYYGDRDGLNLFAQIKEDTAENFVAILEEYFTSKTTQREHLFLKNRCDESRENLNNLTSQVFEAEDNLRPVNEYIRYWFHEMGKDLQDIPQVDREEFIKAYNELQEKFYNEES